MIKEKLGKTDDQKEIDEPIGIISKVARKTKRRYNVVQCVCAGNGIKLKIKMANENLSNW